ncbi:Beta-glucanase precursor [Vibrio aerogenes CECT 7868]|uniref:Beta-glucanase n=1 Tax=Vibrio aerogenes CECT 7868 TaxID=1216006 RepID=A0A1M5XQ78_9VIBR|nr:carbohydrate-binding protein [Vibrio aerogenes]SHI01678.1 Beta-glucanase precursor [Vibrio aerogenes CECT 7868]
MKKLNKTLVLVGCAAFSQSALSANWQLVWHDEFTNSIGPDWVFETGNGASGWGNNELEYYQRENATVENGNLVITAKKQNSHGFKYTSARMKTQGLQSFKYGKIEARIKLPNGSGLWPAFWMLGRNIDSVSWPYCGEIDIMEHVNNESQTHGTIHWQADKYANYTGHSFNIDVTQYHTYTVEWDKGEIRWYVDGTMYHVANILNNINGTDEFHKEFFILFNLAVGGNWPGFNIDDSKMPAKMYVDYVRVYQDKNNTSSSHSGNNGGGSSFSKTIQAENYSSMKGVGTQDTSDTGGGKNVGWIDTGDWMAFNNIKIPATGDYLVEYRVASAEGGAKLSLDHSSGATVLGYLDIGSTGGWQNWKTISHRVHINAGTYNFGIYAQKGGFNLNWWKIKKL